jgi:hypothetical protein
VSATELAITISGVTAAAFALGFGLGYRFWVDYITGPGRHRLTEREDETWAASTVASSGQPEQEEAGNEPGSAAWLREAREKLATTGELRILAETGEIERLHAETAAWHAITRLEEWTR